MNKYFNTTYILTLYYYINKIKTYTNIDNKTTKRNVNIHIHTLSLKWSKSIEKSQNLSNQVSYCSEIVNLIPSALEFLMMYVFSGILWAFFETLVMILFNVRSTSACILAETVSCLSICKEGSKAFWGQMDSRAGQRL